MKIRLILFIFMSGCGLHAPVSRPSEWDTSHSIKINYFFGSYRTNQLLLTNSDSLILTEYLVDGNFNRVSFSVDSLDLFEIEGFLKSHRMEFAQIDSVLECEDANVSTGNRSMMFTICDPISTSNDFIIEDRTFVFANGCSPYQKERKLLESLLIKVNALIPQEYQDWLRQFP